MCVNVSEGGSSVLCLAAFAPGALRLASYSCKLIVDRVLRVCQPLTASRSYCTMHHFR